MAMQPRRVLVAEDEASLRDFVSRNLRARGFAVVEATNGLEALALWESEAPQLLVLDVMMPRMDGIEVVRTLKADKATAGIPVILLSAKAQSTDINGGLDAGADDYVTKPFDPLELLDKVAALIGTPEGDDEPTAEAAR